MRLYLYLLIMAGVTYLIRMLPPLSRDEPHGQYRRKQHPQITHLRHQLQQIAGPGRQIRYPEKNAAQRQEHPHEHIRRRGVKITLHFPPVNGAHCFSLFNK